MEIFVDGNGVRWAFDAERMAGMLRTAAYFQTTVANSSVVSNREHWMQKIRILPPTGAVQSNLALINKSTARLLEENKARIENLKQGGWEDFEQFLAARRQEFDRNRVRLQNMQRSVKDLNDMAIKSAEMGITISRGVRDASIASIGIIATVATGGTAFYVATAASAVGTGAATYQDTGNVTKAVAGAAFVMIPLGAGRAVRALNIAGANKVITKSITILVDIAADTGNSVLVDDKDIETAITEAAMNSAKDLGISFLSKEVSKQVGQEIRDTIRAIDQHNGRESNRAASLVMETGTKFAGWAGTKTGEFLMSPGNPPGGQCRLPPQPPLTGRAWVNKNVLRRL